MEKNLIHIPIEPLSERYSEQWYRNFPLMFRNAGYKVRTLAGEPLIEDGIQVGSFLDINSTTHYKWAQLQQLSRMFQERTIKDGTVIFFGDIEFWGLEAVRLLADMNKVSVKLVGFLHAASYTLEDAFEIAAPYQQYTEVGWIAALDAVFVGSRYHKQAVATRRLRPLGASRLEDRIHVTGNPIFLEEYPSYTSTKEKLVVLTNRFDSEKRPGQTLNLFATLKQQFPDWRFLVCTGRDVFRSNDPELVRKARALEDEGVIEIHAGITKDQYHEILSRAAIMVSHSIEENFGYCIVESMLYNCVPVLRHGLSHTELVRDNPLLLFENEAEALFKMRVLMDSFSPDSGCTKVASPTSLTRISLADYCLPYIRSVEKMIEIMDSLPNRKPA